MDEVRARVVDLDLNDVLPNRFQPRIKFSEDSIIELSESIKEHGVIQPIVVRPIGDKYEIIAGERRYKASVLAGKETIPAIITDLNDKDSAEVALIENVQRKDLTAIEEAISYKKILDMGYLTQEQLAVKLGKSQSTIANKIRLLNLCDEVQEALMEDKISERHARSMLKLQSAEKQRLMLEKIINERLTVRKTDEEIDKMNTYITNPIDTPEQQTNNPGFVDVDKIANNAQDLKFEDPAGNVNINALLQGNNPPAVNPVESNIPVIPTIEPISTNNIFNAAPVDLLAPAAPTVPEEQTVPIIPAVEPIMPVASAVEPVVPVIPEIPPVSAVEVSPSVPEIPVVSSVPEFPEISAAPSAPVSPVVDLQTAYDLPPVPLVDPFSPNSDPIMPVSPTVEPVVPVIPEIPPVPTVPEEQPVPTIPAVEPIMPVASAVEPAQSVFPGMPTITPIGQSSFSGIAPSPTTPIVEESLPSKFLDTEEEPPAAPSTPVSPVVPLQNELEEAEAKLDEKTDEIKPIIITDYSKQYDPVLPETTAPVIQKVDFKQIINLIRDVNNTIEKCGYTIETEEYDLEGVYQVIFKIDKN